MATDLLVRFPETFIRPRLTVATYYERTGQLHALYGF